jgi:iron complex outermembrane recepter protein
MFQRKPLTAAISSIMAVGAMGMAEVASPESAYAAEAPIEELVVTGSRIARGNLTAPTAVTTIDSVAIEQSGFINVADVLRTLPAFGVSTLSSGNSNFLTSASGINTLQLRNLEEDRTLVLVNGRRYVSGLAGSGAVDFNTVPTALIDRVEVITGGASAIYGSDALAGVINVILKDDFEGLEVSFQTGETTRGGDVQNEVTLTAGSNFADGRGNAVISATYSDQKGLLARQRGNTRLDGLAECLFTGVAADCGNEISPTLSSFSEFGRFFIPSTGDSFTVSQGAGPDGTVVPWSGDFGFNRQEFRRYTVPTERYLVSTLMNYDINNNVNFFAEAMFAQTRTQSELEPFPHSNEDLNIAGVSIDNPFVPQALRDAAVAAGDDVIEYWRRTTEVGQRGASATRDTYRLVVGLNGTIQDRWNWETFAAYGRMDDVQQGGGQINVLNMRNALNVIDGDGDTATFDPVCADAAARAEGCVPINIFGRGAISPDAAAYVVAPTSRQQFAEQRNIGATVAGPMFTIPAGEVAFAAGFEWREELAADVPDVLTQAGLNAGNAEAPTRGEYDVWEAFVEVEVPLLADMPLIEELTLGGAYRYSDYSTVGKTHAYTGRLSWMPVESLRFRAQYARAVRAPNITELFAPGGENFEPVADPCNNVTVTTPGQIADNCRSIPEIAARIAAVGVFELSLAEIQGTGGFTSSGNENLDAEESDSWNVGTVYDTDLGRPGSLTLSVDYFKIKIEDLIDTVGRQQTIDFCFNVPPSQFPNNFCAALTRDGTGPAFQLGELTEVNSGFINEGTLETEGIDVAIRLDWDMADWFARVPGNGTFRTNYTYLLDFTEKKFGSEDDRVGETGYAEHKWQMGLGYYLGPWSFAWEWNYIDDSVPTNASALFSQYDVGSFSTHDLYVSFDLAASGFGGNLFGEGTIIYAGLNNAFNEDAPVILTGVPGNTTGTDTDASVYSPLGRVWYAGIRARF